MFIAGIGTATPSTRYLQTECWEVATTSPLVQQLAPRSRALLRKVLLANNGIESRHLALNPLSEVFECSPDVLHARFTRHAPALGRSFLTFARFSAADIFAFFIALT